MSETMQQRLFGHVKPWPSRCYNQDKCAIHRKCWWGLGDNLCAHQDRDISREVLAAMNAPLVAPDPT